MNKKELIKLKKNELLAIVSNMNIPYDSKMRKEELVELILDAKDSEGEYISEASEPQISMISIEDLVASPLNFFKPLSEAKFNELKESINANGVLVPLIVRPISEENGKYEILSGHNRRNVAKELGIVQVPCQIKDVDDNMAMEIIVDTNMTQRDEYTPMEIAKAYHEKVNAIGRRQGQRTDLDPKAVKGSVRDIVGKQFKVSGMTVDRYLRLNNLIPEIQEAVDKGDVPVRVGFELGLTDKKTQENIISAVELESVTPRVAQNIKNTLKKKNKMTKKERKEYIREHNTEPPIIPVDKNELFEIIEKRKTRKLQKVSLVIPEDFDKKASEWIVGIAEKDPAMLLNTLKDFYYKNLY